MMIRPALLLVLLVPTATPAVAHNAADEWAHPQVVTVVMVDNQFEPDHVTFQAGKTYELRLQNRGKDLHEFTAPEFFRQATVRDRKQLANGGTEVVVQAGQSARVLLIPRVEGGYKLTCADHDWDGMVGGITVN
jgi:plastocyanin